MSKSTMLPPAAEAERRAKRVHVGFTDEEYQRFKRLASYRKISLPRLIYHVLVNVALPRLEAEMQTELAGVEHGAAGQS